MNKFSIKRDDEAAIILTEESDLPGVRVYEKHIGKPVHVVMVEGTTPKGLIMTTRVGNEIAILTIEKVD
jgi:hypothetical protein